MEVIEIGKDRVLAKLQAEVTAAGGIRAWSRAHPGFSASFISDVLTDKLAPSKKLLALLRFEREVKTRYRAIDQRVSSIG